MSEYSRLLAEVQRKGIKHQIKFERGESKPYFLWVHDDDWQLAADTLFRESSE